MSSSAESVRVILRFRPQRSELLRGGGQGGSLVPTGKGGLGHVGKAGAAAAKGAQATEGFRLEFDPDNKSLTYHSPVTGGTRPKPALFTFDHIFGPDSTQAEAFDAIARHTVDDVLKGYNGTIFAYGQTGSGKTFTMFGPSNQPELRGVIPRAADALFSGIEQSSEIEEVTIKCSFLEIYKEAIRDLLAPKNSGLKIRELPTGEVYVQGLSDQYVGSCAEIMQLLGAGEKNRSTASTEMNEVSSRSHSVLIVVVSMKLKDGSSRVGKLNLADLAGSERIERTNAKGDTLDEAKKINQSLSALGNCINALTDSKRSHIPFRDSTLTFLLKDSLGGNTKTTLLCAASGEDNDCAETLSTLMFAKRAKKIRNTVSQNVKLGVAELTLMVQELRGELSRAHKQITTLQKTIQTMAAGGSIPKEMLDALLKPVKTSNSVHAIEALTPLAEMGAGAVPVGMLDAALHDVKRRLSSEGGAANLRLEAASPTLGDAGLLEHHELLSPLPSPPSVPELDESAEPPSSASAAVASASPVANADNVAPAEANGVTAEQTAALAAAVEAAEAATAAAVAAAAEREATHVKEREEAQVQLSSAQSELDSVKDQLEAAQQHADRRELEWETERERMLAEFEQLKTEAAAAQAAASAANAAAAAAAAVQTVPAEEPLSAPAVANAQASPVATSVTVASLPASPSPPSTRDAATSVSVSPDAATSVTAALAPAASPPPPLPPRQRSPTVAGVTLPSSSPRTAGGSVAGGGLPLVPATPDPLIAALRNKNSRLEREIAAMKETWTAYLDLILENQKAQQAERERSEAAAVAALQPPSVESTPTRPGGARVVKPVKAGGGNKQGFFATLKSKFDGSKKTPTSPAPSEASGDSRQSTPARSSLGHQPSSAASSTFSSPNPGHQRNISSATPAGTPAGQSSASAMASPKRASGTSRPSMTPVPTSSVSNAFASAIRIGYLAKRPVGFSLTRGWKERLFVLRPQSLDYYEVNNGGGGGAEAATPSATPPDGSPALSRSVSSSSIGPVSSSSYLRGSVVLDAHTTVVAANYGPEAPFGFEVTTREKHSKLQARDETERQAWMADLLAVVSCIKRGVDPAVLVPNSDAAAALQADSSPEDAPAAGSFTLDPDLVTNANFLLQSALERLPEPSPTAALAAAAVEADGAKASNGGSNSSNDGAPAINNGSSVRASATSLHLTAADLEDGVPKVDVSARPPQPCLVVSEPEPHELEAVKAANAAPQPLSD